MTPSTNKPSFLLLSHSGLANHGTNEKRPPRCGQTHTLRMGVKKRRNAKNNSTFHSIKAKRSGRKSKRRLAPPATKPTEEQRLPVLLANMQPSSAAETSALGKPLSSTDHSSYGSHNHPKFRLSLPLETNAAPVSDPLPAGIPQRRAAGTVRKAPPPPPPPPVTNMPGLTVVHTKPKRKLDDTSNGIRHEELHKIGPPKPQKHGKIRATCENGRPSTPNNKSTKAVTRPVSIPPRSNLASVKDQKSRMEPTSQSPALPVRHVRDSHNISKKLFAKPPSTKWEAGVQISSLRARYSSAIGVTPFGVDGVFGMETVPEASRSVPPHFWVAAQPPNDEERLSLHFGLDDVEDVALEQLYGQQDLFYDLEGKDDSV